MFWLVGRSREQANQLEDHSKALKDHTKMENALTKKMEALEAKRAECVRDSPSPLLLHALPRLEAKGEECSSQTPRHVFWRPASCCPPTSCPVLLLGVVLIGGAGQSQALPGE